LIIIDLIDWLSILFDLFELKMETLIPINSANPGAQILDAHLVKNTAFEP
jgi:hypothetical protein